MTAAAGSTRVPRRSHHNTQLHSTSSLTTRVPPPRGRHEPDPPVPDTDTHLDLDVVDVPDVTPCTSHADQERLEIESPPIRTAAGKVDSLTKTTSRAHSRLASLGRIRSRGSIHNTAHPRPAGVATELPSQRGETLPVKQHTVPVSPSDASSHHKRSDASTLSNTSSETALSDDKSEDIKSFDDQPLVRSSSWVPPKALVGGAVRRNDDPGDVERYQQAVQHRPRMMHQTSSRLLRMTADDRPFTRVCTA